MAAPELWLALGFALLNTGLAVLSFRIRPTRLAHVLLGVLFLSNAATTARDAVSLATGWEAGGAALAGSLDAPSLVALAFLPWFFPDRRLGPRAERSLLLGGGVYVLGLVAFLYSPAPATNPGQLGSSLLRGLVPYAAFAVGVRLLASSYTAGGSWVTREQARIVLAAYVLKTASSLSALVTAVAPGPHRLADLWTSWPGFLSIGALAYGLTAAAALIASSQPKRRRLAGPAARRADLFLLSFLLLGLTLGLGAAVDQSVRSTFRLEHLIVRPLLLAYGILRLQILETDLRAHAPLIGATLAAGAFVTGLALFDVFSTWLSPVVAVSAAVVVLAVLVAPAAASAWRLLRRHHSPWDAQGRLVRRGQYVDWMGSATPPPDVAAVVTQLRRRLGTLEPDPATPLAHDRRALVAGRYRVQALLGAGVQGHAILARDEADGSPVVLKIIPARSAKTARRAADEALHLSLASHSKVLRIRDVQAVGDHVALVTEYAAGGSLEQQLAEGPLPVERAVAIVSDVLEGLQAAHVAGLVHGDVKPSNILLTGQDEARLADFGLAMLSETGAVRSYAGSLPYMSPEQVRGGHVDVRSDLYSAGAVLYECLTGSHHLRSLREGHSDPRRAITVERPDLPIANLPQALNSLLASALAKDPAFRPPDAATFQARLLEAANTEALAPGATDTSMEAGVKTFGTAIL